MFPFGALTLAPDGSHFYGTTNEGGNFGYGTLFCINSSGGIAIPHHFNGTDGGFSFVPPIQGADGNLYGITTQGSGTAYQFALTGPDPCKGTFKKLTNPPGPTTGPLVLAPDGFLYGTTFGSGAPGSWTVFRMATPGGAMKVIHTFNDTDGASPQGPLTGDFSQTPWDENLYGVTYGGGANNTGEIFKVTVSGRPSGNLTILHSFPPLNNGTNNDGAQPVAGLLLASDGYLYGVTTTGGANGYGTIFSINTSGTKFNKLFDFTGATGAVLGAYPTTTLMEGTDGCYYGATSGGVAPNETTGFGNVYNLCPASLIQIVKVAGPIFVLPGVPVQILGENLTQTFEVTFNGESTQFQVGSDSNLTAQVPNDAVDGLVAVILDSGLQMQTQSAMHILPVIKNLDPTSGPVGTQVGIVGGGFAGAKKVTFGGVKATQFTVVNPTLIQAIVPPGARTGKVKVTTPNGTASSTQIFIVN
jgi:uncharacterized repeat protein (TIGR03803 family)